MGAQNQSSVSLVGVGGVAPYTFSIIQDSETTVPATISGSTLTVDATGLQPGVYSVHVGVVDQNGATANQTISVRAVDSGVFAILNTSDSVAPQSFPLALNVPLLSVGGIGAVTWSLVPGVTSLPSAVIVNNALTASLTQFGTWAVGLRATDSLSNTCTKVIEISALSTSFAAVVDGQIELTLDAETEDVGTHQFTITVADANENTVTQTFNYTLDEPISRIEIDDSAADHDWGAGDSTSVVFPIAGDLSGFAIGSVAPIVADNGLTATIDAVNQAVVITGPPSAFGNAEINVPLALMRNNTQVATITRTFSLMSHAGTGSFGDFTCATRPYIVGDFVALNPLKPYFNAPGLVKNQTYAVQLAANNTLPRGLSLDSVSGQVYGMLLAADVAQSVLQYVDTTGTVQANVTINWNLQASAFAVVDATGDGQIQVPFTLTFDTSSSSPLTGVTVYRGRMPLGMGVTIDTTQSNVVLTGTPAEAGYFDLWFAVNNANGQTAYFYKRLAIDYIEPLVVLTDELPQVVTGSAYQMTLAAFGGTAPYTWSISTGSLPTNITLSPSSGVLSGTTTDTSYSQSLTIMVTDQRGVTANVVLALAINNALQIATTTLPLVTPGQNYSFQTQATGGTAPYSWSLGNGSPTLPGGFQLSSSGLLSGATSLTSYNTNLILQVTDAANNVVTRTLQLAIGVPSGLTIDTEGVGPIVRGKAYQGLLVAEGIGLAPYNWAVSPDSPNPMPAGLTLTTSASNNGATATISGSTSVALLNYAVKVQVVDANANTAYTFLLLNTFSSLQVTTYTLPQATRTGTYDTQLTASGVNAPFTWSLDPNSPAMPTGMTLSSTGDFSGVPTIAGTTALIFRVTDAIGDFATATLNFICLESTLATVTTTLTNVTAGKAYSAALAATGGTAPYSWSISPNSATTLPSGLSLNASTGVISGTSVAVGFNRQITFRVTDSITVYREVTLALAVVSSLKAIAGPDYVNGTTTNSLGAVAAGDPEFINPRPNLSFYVVATGVVSVSAAGLKFGLPAGFGATVESLINGVATIKLTGPFASGAVGTNTLSLNITDSGVSVSVTFNWTRYSTNPVFFTPASGSFPVIYLN